MERSDDMNVFKNELKRSICNKWTFIALAITSVFCILQFWDKYELQMETLKNLDEMGLQHLKNRSNGSAYQSWILFDQLSNYRYILLWIFPIIATLPYGLSYYSDIKSGYIKQIATRTSMKTYTRAKYVATFISGGTVVVLPLILNFMLNATIIPLNKPFRLGNLVVGKWFLTDVFYDHPLLYTLLKFMLVFIVAGLLSTVALLVSKYIYNMFSVFVTPFVVAFLLEFSVYLTENHFVAFSYNLRAENVQGKDFAVLCIEIAVLFVVTYFGYVSSKREVY